MPEDDDVRLDRALVDRGLSRSRAIAKADIEAGRVTVDGVPARRSSQLVTRTADLQLARESSTGHWVGRGALKLVHALDHWAPSGLTATDRVCLDVGASTGGFTQVLLHQGARQVTALDVGSGQLVAALADNPRVQERSGVNIRDVTTADFPAGFHLIVVDLSFISLRLVLPVLTPVLRPAADLVLLVKPQFEVGRERLGKGGVVRSAHLRREALSQVGLAAAENGLHVADVIASPVTGTHGNAEYLMWLTSAPAGMMGPDSVRSPVLTSSEISARIASAIAADPREEGR